MTMNDVDPVDVMAAHAGTEGGYCHTCVVHVVGLYEEPWPCIPYVLAFEVQRLRRILGEEEYFPRRAMLEDGDKGRIIYTDGEQHDDTPART